VVLKYVREKLIGQVKESIYKTITYRLLATVSTILICVMLGLPIDISGLIGLVELVFKPILYFIHELLWKKYVSR